MTEPSLFERHPKRALAAILVVFTLVSLLAAEFVLRAFGYAPGRTFYKPVEDLVVTRRFFTDEHGIFKANAAVPIDYFGNRVAINRDGFRGPDFTPPVPGQKSILLLGDSFTYGSTAVPLEKSFADLLARAGYRVYNCGIPAVGARQYEALAKVYIPKLEPDHVVVGFYMGNDLRRRPDSMLPNRDLYHITNAGWLSGFDDDGQPLTAEEAYAYYIGSQVRLQRLAYSTALGTTVWNAVRALLNGELSYRITALISHRDPVVEYAQSFDRLRSIRAIAEASGARFHTLVIPSFGRNCSRYERRVDHYRAVFDTLEPIYLDDIPRQAFHPWPDCHLDNRGHRFVARRIRRAIR